MIDVANAILSERRVKACRERQAHKLPQRRSMAVGRYKLTVTKSGR